MSDATPETLGVEISSPLERVTLVALSGELDLVSAARLERIIAGLQVDAPTHVVIDLSALSFIDSTGVNALIRAIKTIEDRGGTGALAAPSPITRRVLEITRVGQLVHLELDRDAAFAWRPDLVDAGGSADGSR